MRVSQRVVDSRRKLLAELLDREAGGRAPAAGLGYGKACDSAANNHFHTGIKRTE